MLRRWTVRDSRGFFKRIALALWALPWLPDDARWWAKWFANRRFLVGVNIVVFDAAAAWTVGERPWASMARNSAFTGRRLRGRVVHTLRRGEFMVRDGEATR